MPVKESGGEDVPKNGDQTGRDQRGRFVKGNPGGGRTPIPDEVKEMLKAATADAARLLIETMTDKSVPIKLRLDCANAVMDRVYGRPTQPIDGEIDAHSAFEVTIRVLDNGN